MEALVDGNVWIRTYMVNGDDVGCLLSDTLYFTYGGVVYCMHRDTLDSAEMWIDLVQLSLCHINER